MPEKLVWEAGDVEIERRYEFAEQPHSGVLVSLWLDLETADQLPALGVDPEEMHITVLYDREATVDDLLDYAERLRRVAAGFDPLDGATSGLGRFFGGETDVIIAIPDIKGLDLLRNAVYHAIGRDPSEHGYNPHITLAYVPRAAPTPFSEVRQFHLGGQHDQKSHGGGVSRGAPADLDPRNGVRYTPDGSYGGGFPRFKGERLSNESLGAGKVDQTGVDTDKIQALREYNANIPSTYSIPDDAPVWYRGKEMTRQQMREQIASEFLDGKMDENFQGYAQEKVMDIYMGPPAAGKSGAVAKTAGEKYIEVDSDRVKTVLPEFNRGRNANGVHDESSAINEAILHGAMERGYKIALPVVGKSEGSLMQHVDLAVANGYKVNIHMVHADAPSITNRMRDRVTQTGRFVDPKYYTESVKDKPLDVFRKVRNDPRISSTTAWDTSFREGAPYGFPASQRPAFAFADVGQDNGSGVVGRGTPDSTVPTHRGEESTGLHGGLEPLAYVEDSWAIPYHSVPLHFAVLTVSCGDTRIELPFLGDDDVVFDTDDVMDFGEDWTRERFRRFAEWLGYNIEPNTESSLGFRVTSPSGKALGGAVASRIIDAWKTNPNPDMSGKKGGKKGAKKGASGASKAEATLKKQQKAAEQLATAQNRAIETLDRIDAETLETRSKGKVSAEVVDSFKAAAQERLKTAPDAKAVREIIREMKQQITDYRTEMTKPPTWDVQLKNTKAKLKESLPSASRLAGVSFDEDAIQKIVDKHSRAIDTAATEEDARRAVKDLRNAVADYKLQEQKRKKAQKELDALNRSAQKELNLMPTTASEWADFYTDRLLGPEQFHASHDQKTHGRGVSIDAMELEADSKALRVFKDNYFGSSQSYWVNNQLRGRGDELNSKLQNEKAAVAAPKLLKAADKASVPLGEDLVVQRALRFGDGKIPPEFKKGAVITDKGFTSTTTDPKWTEYHSRKVKGIVLNIELPKGSKVIPNGAESELVIKPPSRYEITGRKGNTFTARMLP